MTAPVYQRNLSPGHQRELFEGSAISPEVANQRGYATVGKKDVPEQFKPAQRGAGLLIPLWDVHGEQAGFQLKRSEPRTIRNRLLKYETPAGSKVMIDVHPRCQPHLGNIERPLWVTEGTKKADALISTGADLCVIDISGVSAWRGRNRNGDLTALADWESIALKSSDGLPRNVMLAFDSDIATNRNVQKAVKRLMRFLQGKGAQVSVLVMPDLANGEKCGIDDYLAHVGKFDDLKQYVQSDVPTVEVERGTEAPYSDSTYRSMPTGFYRVSINQDGEEEFTRLTDFVAWIAKRAIFPESPELNYSEIVLRDSTGRVHGPERVPDAQFGQMITGQAWLFGLFGSTRRVFPGATSAHLINALQVASGADVPVTTAFDRLGWRRDGSGQWQYLTSAGALGTSGLDSSILVQPGGRLEHHVLQDTDDAEALRSSVRTSLDMVGIGLTDQGKAAIMALQALAFRAPLIVARSLAFSTVLVGETGSGKSGLAGLALQYFGPQFDYSFLTDTWNSTANSLMDLTTRARHTIAVIDDYLEVGSGLERQAHNRDMLIRAIGNGASKGRLRADSSRLDSPEPQTALVSTQETTGSFRHASEAARQLILALERGDISIDRLKNYSRSHGRSGELNFAMSGYISWLASEIDDISAQIDSSHDAFMDLLTSRLAALELHPRTIPNLAELLAGTALYLRFATSIGAITNAEAGEYRDQTLEALIHIAHQQAAEQGAENPGALIVELLQQLFASRKASLRDRLTNDVPDSPTMAGWQQRTRKTYSGTEAEYTPATSEVGWIDDEFIYLNAAATSQALQAIARDSRVVVPTGQRQLGAVLVRSGIASVGDTGKHTRQIEVGSQTEEGATRQRVIKISRSLIFPGADATEEESNIREFPVRRA